MPPTVFVVDDNTAVRRSMRWLVESIGLAVETYASAQEFLAAYKESRPGCLVVDVRMPGISGPELQEQLVARGSTLPVIFVTGYGDVATAVRTLKLGAEDFIQKPFSNQLLLDRIQHAISVDAVRREIQSEVIEVRTRIARLTSREREVADLVASGRPSKVIASDLGVTEKTVEFHRANIMAKLGARSLAELLRIVIRAQGFEKERGHSSGRSRD